MNAHEEKVMRLVQRLYQQRESREWKKVPLGGFTTTFESGAWTDSLEVQTTPNEELLVIRNGDVLLVIDEKSFNEHEFDAQKARQMLKAIHATARALVMKPEEACDAIIAQLEKLGE